MIGNQMSRGSHDDDSNSVLRQKFGGVIRKGRERLGLSEAFVAVQSGIQLADLQAIELGNHIPDKAVLISIANTLRRSGVTYQELLLGAQEIEDPGLALHLDEGEYAEELACINLIESPRLQKALRRLLVVVDRGILNKDQGDEVAREVIRRMDGMIDGPKDFRQS